jgi:hypothetical protein
MRRIREQCILVSTSDYLIADICQAIETYPITCVLWLGPTFFTPMPSLVSTANMLRSRRGYQVISKGDHEESVTSLLRSFGPEVDELYQDGLIDPAEDMTVEGIPGINGKMTWLFQQNPNEPPITERHTLVSGGVFGCFMQNGHWSVDTNLDGFWVIQRDHAPIPFYREGVINATFN